MAPKKRSRANKQSQVAAVPRNLRLGIPPYMDAELVYATSATLSFTNICTKWTFRVNSLYDPDKTGIGHQPLYFDQYAAMYNKYHVTSGDIRVNMTNTNGGELGTAAMVVVTDENSPSLEAVKERDRNYVVLGVPTNSTSRQVLKARWNEKALFPGISKNDDTLSANVVDNPTAFGYYNLFYQGWGANAFDVYTAVDISFKVRFYGINTASAS
jgi:hypothetical protein